MSTRLDDRQKRALNAYRMNVARLKVPDAIPSASLTDLEALHAFVPLARRALRRATREGEMKLATAQAIIAAAPKPGQSDEASWRRLEEACRKIEQELRAPSSLRSRLEEGRRSAQPKLESHIRRLLDDTLEVTLTTEGNRIIARNDRNALSSVTDQGGKWAGAWASFVVEQIEVDLSALIDELWLPREADLPIKRPELTPIPLPELVWSAPEPGQLKLPEFVMPEVQLTRDRKSLGSRAYRSTRSLLYGVLSLGLLFGVSRSDAMGGSGATGLLGGGLFLMAVAYGIFQARAEQAQAEERLKDELRQRASQVIWETTRRWLDRVADKLTNHIRLELSMRRVEMVNWYRSTVQPVIDRRKQLAQERGAAAEEARRTLPQKQSRVRDLGRAVQELDKLVATLPRAAAR